MRRDSWNLDRPGLCDRNHFLLVFHRPALREESERSGAITLPTFLAASYRKGQSVIRVLSTFIIAFFFIFYLSAQFNGAGKS
ncbi:MAG: hypothetical protein R2751_00600 [Bacteroidales bacterium]